MKKDFIPRRNADLNSFEKNFLRKLEQHVTALELRSTDFADPVKAIEENLREFEKLNLITASYHAACESYKATRKRSVSELRRLSRFIKNSRNFSSVYGDDFGIFYPDGKFESHPDLKPILKLKVDDNKVFIKYNKQGADALNIYSKKGNEIKFKFLERVSRNTYIDKRPKTDRSKPEAREYYGIYIKRDKEEGNRSDVVKVVIP